MINIKRSDIQALLANYRDSIKNASFLSSPFRKVTGSLPKILADLNDFITELNSPSIDPDELTPEQTHQLTTILLGRRIRLELNNEEKLSECLVKELEGKIFNRDEFSELKKHFDSNTLDLDKFITICKLNSTIPQENTASSPDSIVQTQSPELMQQPLDQFIDAGIIASEGSKQDEEVIQLPESYFLQCDEYLLKEIIRAAPLASMMGLSRVSKHHAAFFLKHGELRDPLRQLLSHVALGELEQAEKIWRQCPSILTHRGTIYHPNRIYKGDKIVGNISFHHNPGRYQYNNRTPLQILWINEEYEEAKFMEEIVGPREMARQFFEVFPDGIIKKDNFDLEHAKTLLNKVFKAIANDKTINSDNFDQMNKVTRAALYALHDYAKPEFEHKTGLVFDPHFYLAALELYDKQASKMFKGNWSKYDFWCIRVEEWLAGCLATGYLRPHAQGIGNNVVHRRGCLLADKSSYFAFRRVVNSFPGLHCFIGYFGRLGLGLGQPGRRRQFGRGGWFSNIMSSKKHLSEQLMQACNSSPETNPRPVK